MAGMRYYNNDYVMKYEIIMTEYNKTEQRIDYVSITNG